MNCTSNSTMTYCTMTMLFFGTDSIACKNPSIESIGSTGPPLSWLGISFFIFDSLNWIPDFFLFTIVDVVLVTVVVLLDPDATMCNFCNDGDDATCCCKVPKCLGFETNADTSTHNTRSIDAAQRDRLLEIIFMVYVFKWILKKSYYLVVKYYDEEKEKRILIFNFIEEKGGGK